MTQTATEASTTTRKGIETTGIEVVEESQRTARPRDLFLPWFASNVSVFGMSYGAFMLGFGVSFWQAMAATLIGVIVSFGFCGIIAIAGKRGSAPTMVLSRAAFGTQGNKIPGVLTVIYLIMAVGHIDWHAATSLPSASFPAFIGALTLVMTGTGLGWTNIAADWSRYQSRKSSGFSIAFWNVFGASLPLIILITGGLLLAASSKDLSDAIGADPIGALATILPTWFLIPFLLAAILSLLAGAINGIYSSGLTLLTLGIRVPRPAASLIDGTILTIGTLYVVFVAPNFISPFQSFLVTLGVPLSAWTGIMMADITLRRRPYDEADLFDGSGRYGHFDLTSIITFVVVTIIGWGLVVNTYEGVNWNNWQGFLLGPLGLGGREGDWAYANLGVLGALVLGYVVTLIARRGKVRRQESR